MRSRTLFGLALVGLACAAADPAFAVERDPADNEVVARMRARAPHAANLLEEGEKLAVGGSLEEALGRFRQGRAEDSMGAGLFERRECEALTSLNRPAEAQTACWQAMQDLRTPTTVAATVRALVSGPTAPSFRELKQSLTVLAVERNRAPDNVPLAAAMCDIAESIGDGIMLQHCAETLERIAPTYGPTRRAQRALDQRCPPWRFWTGWLAIATAILVTVASALWSLAGRGRRGSAAGALGAVMVALLLAFGSAHAEDPPLKGRWLSQWPIDDKDPEKSIPPEAEMQKDPLEAGYLLQDLLSKAELASKHGDHEAAVKFYAAVLKAVPNRALPLIKMCDEFEALDQLNNAINACGLALLGDGLAVRDYARYVHLVLKKPGDLTEKDVAAVTNVVQHVKDEEPTSGNELECDIGVRTGNVAMLRACTAALAAAAPNDPKTITYQWALAVREGDFGTAKRLLDQGKSVGMSDESIKRMEMATSAGAGKQRKSRLLTGCGALALAGALAYALVLLARRRAAPAPA